MSAEQPKGIRELFAEAFAIYRRYPALFLILAAAVIVPWEFVVLAIHELGSNSDGELNFLVVEAVAVANLALVGPLVSALHVHAVAEIREGGEPALTEVARKGIRALPLVAFAAFVSTIGVYLGMLALFVPGFLLLVRWAVVAQAAAIEREGWLAPLRRSFQLTGDQFGHVIAFLLLVGAVTGLPTLVLWFVSGKGDVTVVSVLIRTPVSVLAVSFSALAMALLYFDLRERLGTRAAAAPPPGDRAPWQASWDPRVYADEERPAGWYIDPAMPHRMTYWTDADPAGWVGKARTPRKIRKAWRAELPEP